MPVTGATPTSVRRQIRFVQQRNPVNVGKKSLGEVQGQMVAQVHHGGGMVHHGGGMVHHGGGLSW